MLDPQYAIMLLSFIGILFSIVVHECAHGVVAYWCGDDTAYRLGRITLNPLPHIDPFMSILMPALLMYAHQPAFGGARPVPVVTHNLRNPRRDMMWVAWAGPMTNILLAAAFALASNVLVIVRDPAFADQLQKVFRLIVLGNINLAAFNLIPIPPLDGSKILAGLLPPDLGDRLMSVPTLQGFVIIFVLIYLGVMDWLLAPVTAIAATLLRFLSPTIF